MSKNKTNTETVEVTSGRGRPKSVNFADHANNGVEPVLTATRMGEKGVKVLDVATGEMVGKYSSIESLRVSLSLTAKRGEIANGRTKRIPGRKSLEIYVTA